MFEDDEQGQDDKFDDLHVDRYEEGNTNLFVGQLPFSKCAHDLRMLFGSVGQVNRVIMVKDKTTNSKEGCDFCGVQ
eukprot:2382616-Karenia_brevis.AAC.1